MLNSLLLIGVFRLVINHHTIFFINSLVMINGFYQIRTKLLAVKQSWIFAEVEKSDLIAQYKELNENLKV